MFPAFICANDIGSLVNNFFRVKIFNPFPSFSSSSSSSSGCISTNSFSLYYPLKSYLSSVNSVGLYFGSVSLFIASDKTQYSSKYIARKSLCKSEALSYAYVLSSFVLCFCGFSLLNPFKSFQISARNKNFGSKVSLSIFLLSRYYL